MVLASMAFCGFCLIFIGYVAITNGTIGIYGVTTQLGDGAPFIGTMFILFGLGLIGYVVFSSLYKKNE